MINPIMIFVYFWNLYVFIQKWYWNLIAYSLFKRRISSLCCVCSCFIYSVPCYGHTHCVSLNPWLPFQLSLIVHITHNDSFILSKEQKDEDQYSQIQQLFNKISIIIVYYSSSEWLSYYTVLFDRRNTMIRKKTFRQCYFNLHIIWCMSSTSMPLTLLFFHL